jgi:hypothetical protein
MTLERQKNKVVELLTNVDVPPLFQRSAQAFVASVVPVENECCGGPASLLYRSASAETARQMVQNIAGFFSQVATWDAVQCRERRAA